MLKKTIVTSSIALVLGLSACSEQKTAEQYIASAKILVENNDASTAIVELKNAIKQSPRNADARQLLGDIYLSTGKYLDAEKELEKAIELSERNDKVLAALSFVKLKLNKVQEVYEITENAASTSDEQYVKLLINSGIAALNNGELSRGEDYLGQALSIPGQASDHYLAEAYLKLTERQLEEALVLIDNITQSDEAYLEALYLKGSTLQELKQYEASLSAYEEYSKQKPFDQRILLLVAKNLIHLKDYERVKQVLSSQNLLASSSTANQMRAQADYAQKSYESAIQFADSALQLDSSSTMSKAVYGLSAYQLNNYEQAYYYLNAVSLELPANSPLTGLIAYLKLELGYVVESANDLQELSQPDSKELDLIITASFELLEQGNNQLAQNLISGSPSSGYNEEQTVRLGLLQYATGQKDSIENLEKLLQEDPLLPHVRAAVVAAHITDKENDKAITVLNEWLALEPNSIDANLLAAKTNILLGKVEQGDKYLRKVLQLDSNNTYALMYFAKKAIDSGNSKEAIAKAEEVLTIIPEAKPALFIFYKAHRMAGSASTALERIKNQLSQGGSVVSNKVFYTSLLFMEKQYGDVISELESDQIDRRVVPDKYWQLLGDSYYNIKDLDKARQIYDNWMEHNPTLSVPWFRKMSILAETGNQASLPQLAKNMEVRFPDEPRVKSILPYFQVLNKNYDEAEITISKLSENHRSLPFIRGLMGQISFARKQYKEALDNLIVQYEMKPSPEHAGFVYTALSKQNRMPETFKFMKAHLKNHPQDVVTKAFYAQFMLEHDVKEASKQYKELLVNRPTNIAFLNNLGWSEYKQGHYDSAYLYLDKTFSLAPENPKILDTFAMLLFAQGEVARAKEYIAKAKQLSPDSETIDQHYQEIHQN